MEGAVDDRGDDEVVAGRQRTFGAVFERPAHLTLEDALVERLGGESPCAEAVERARFEAPAGEAITRFQVNLPTRSDLWIGFDRPRGGFDGVLVEVKSGGPQYRDTVLQLQTYRHALPDAEVQRALVLGVVEQPAQGPLRPSQAAWLAAQASGTDDVWAFCGPDDLAAVLAAVGLIKAPLADH